MLRIPEILAPAGDFDALVAAVENGADAVYLGGKNFNARASAGNFEDEEMEKAVMYAHLRNVRVYVTVNILIDNSEIKDVLQYIKKLYDFSVDGIIVQDLGLAFLVRNLLPDLKVHGSTQMTIHNSEGTMFLEQMGIDRVVLAREVALADISAINRRTGMELEIFGHGALCISYSGQCLMSSLIGGRSGNRGRCAQPCRMAYTLVDEKGHSVINKEIGDHLLSPRDLNTLELLPEICEAGIASLKFEGRMKRPEYVATVIRIYRAALDRLRNDPEAFKIFPEEQQQLAQIFNRDFTTGYLIANPGRDLMSYKRPNNRGVRLGRIEEIQDQGKLAAVKLDEKLRIGDGVEIWVTKGGRQGFFVDRIYRQGVPVNEADKGDTVLINILGRPKPGDRIFKTHDINLIEQARASYVQPGKLVPLHIKLSAWEGQPISIEGWDDEANKVTYVSPYVVEKAHKHPADEDSVLQQLNRLGGSGFKLGCVDLDFERGIMLPASELNNGRRFVVENITKKRLEKYQYPPVSQNDLARKWRALTPPPKSKDPMNLKIAVRVSGYEGAQAALEAGADIIYVGGENFSSGEPLNLDQIQTMGELGFKKGKEIVFDLPRIFHEKEKPLIYRMLQQTAGFKIAGLITGNVAGITAAKSVGWTKKLYTDFGLNVFNDFTVKALSQMGISRVTLSPELTFAQIERMNPGVTEMECIAHGALPMMLSQYCAVGSLLGGKTAEKSCNRPCRKKSFGLKDRMNYVFPVEVDQFCRMHVFNPKELCLIEHLDKFYHSGVHAVRIEGKRYHPEVVYQVTKTYRQVKEKIFTNKINQLDLLKIQESLASLSGNGFTKGHYFRGVL